MKKLLLTACALILGLGGDAHTLDAVFGTTVGCDKWNSEAQAFESLASSWNLNGNFGKISVEKCSLVGYTSRMENKWDRFCLIYLLL